MKKIIATISIAVSFYGSVYAQVGINSSAEAGQSAILFSGTNIDLNITDASLGFGINNLQKQSGKNNAFIIGGAVSGKNAEGLSGLFSSGYFVPESKAEGFVGFSRSNAEDLLRIQNLSADPLIRQKTQYQMEFEKSFKEDFSKIIKEEAAKIADATEKQEFIDKIEKNFSAADATKKVGFVRNTDMGIDDKGKAAIVESIRERAVKLLDAHDKKLKDDYTDKLAKIYAADSLASYWKGSIFLIGGINGSEFKRFAGLDSIKLASSFKDQSFRGGYIGLGVNGQWRNFFIGATYSYRVTNNFDLLTKKTYTLGTRDTLGNQELLQEKAITAYAGTYIETVVNEYAVDLAANFRLDDDYHILVNPYMRGIAFSRNKQVLPDKMTLGTGFYFFDKTAKFVGGLYIELADVNNNYEKLKPVDEQNLRRPVNRLGFGITTKFALTSLLRTFSPAIKK